MISDYVIDEDITLNGMVSVSLVRVTGLRTAEDPGTLLCSVQIPSHKTKKISAQVERYQDMRTLLLEWAKMQEAAHDTPVTSSFSTKAKDDPMLVLTRHVLELLEAQNQSEQPSHRKPIFYVTRHLVSTDEDVRPGSTVIKLCAGSRIVLSHCFLPMEYKTDIQDKFEEFNNLAVLMNAILRMVTEVNPDDA